MTPVTGFTTTTQQFSADYDTLFVSPTGTIDTLNDGVYCSSSFTVEEIVNQGYIFGDNALSGNATYSNTVLNYGHVDSDGICLVLSNGQYDNIENSGEISGNSDALDISGGTISVVNSGTITAKTAGANIYATSSSTIDNTGIISGHDFSLELFGSGAFTIHNSGKLAGDVQLGDGDDTFIGHGGTVDGTISGGLGMDKILAGNDGETMNGGAGHDRLYGGAGADTFAFDSFAAADQDHIFKFDVSQDLVQLDHTKFAKLVADQTPTFSVGTAATSPTDYLFYNPSTGVLAYDPDGNGSHYTGYTIATFDKSLALTANNFTVV